MARRSSSRSRARSRPRSRSRSRSRARASRRRDFDRRERSPSSSRRRHSRDDRHPHRERGRAPTQADGTAQRRSRSPSPPRRRGGGGKDERSPPQAMEWGKREDNHDSTEPQVPVEKPNFGLSGALAKDKSTGNVQNGVVMKWSEPPEARVPTRRYRLYVFKGEDAIATLHIHRKSGYLIGREKAVADILTEHESCSKQHAVLQYRLFQKPTKDGLDYEHEVRPYIMDLDSTNGTFLNGKQIDSARYIELKLRDVLKFGESTREYVLMDAS